MANHKSAIKRAQQNNIKRIRNASIRTRIKNAVKDVLNVAKEDSKESVISKLNTAKSIIDKASKKGIIHKNNAARKISRLSQFVNTTIS